MYTGRVSTVTSSSSGTVKVVTGFPVTSASVAFATIPWPTDGEQSSSSSSSSEGGGGSSMLPRIYVSSYESDGFVVTYENIPDGIGYVEFNYSAV
jgi:hypothetical protein